MRCRTLLTPTVLHLLPSNFPRSEPWLIGSGDFEPIFQLTYPGIDAWVLGIIRDIINICIQSVFYKCWGQNENPVWTAILHKKTNAKMDAKMSPCGILNSLLWAIWKYHCICEVIGANDCCRQRRSENVGFAIPSASIFALHLVHWSLNCQQIICFCPPQWNIIKNQNAKAN